MSVRSAEPGDGAPGPAGSTGNENDSILAQSLPRHIVDRLHQANIHTLDQWLALGPGRYQIFGITRTTAEHIDSLAEARE